MMLMGLDGVFRRPTKGNGTQETTKIFKRIALGTGSVDMLEVGFHERLDPPRYASFRRIKKNGTGSLGGRRGQVESVVEEPKRRR